MCVSRPVGWATGANGLIPGHAQPEGVQQANCSYLRRSVQDVKEFSSCVTTGSVQGFSAGLQFSAVDHSQSENVSGFESGTWTLLVLWSCSSADSGCCKQFVAGFNM